MAPSCHRAAAGVAVLLGLAAGVVHVQGFVLPSTPHQLSNTPFKTQSASSAAATAAWTPTPTYTHTHTQPFYKHHTHRTNTRLWFQGQPRDEDKETFAPLATASPDSPPSTSTSPQALVRTMAADRGIDARQLNFLLNLGAISLVATLVLAKVLTVDLDSWRGWTPLEIFFRIPLDNWDGYMNVLTLHPVIVKAITSGSVYTIGDLMAQSYEGKNLGEIDRWRVARSATAGLIGHGPLSHLWYGVSEGFFDWLGWEGWWTTFPKITVDQLVWGPIWNGCYIFLLGIMKKESLGEVWGNVKGTSLSLITSGLKLWPLAHVVTYGVIPVENRLLWVDLVEILWVTILSREATNADAEKEGAATATAAATATDTPLTGEAPAVLASSSSTTTIAPPTPAPITEEIPVSSVSPPAVNLSMVPVPVQVEEEGGSGMQEQ